MLDLDTFLKTYDFTGSVVVLAGSRNVAPEDQEKLRKLGKLLAERSKHISFRSGNADGADQFFTHGVGEVDRQRMEVFIPYATHKRQNRTGYQAFSLDQVDVVNEPTLVKQAKENEGTRSGVQYYIDGIKTGKQMSMGQLILRSTWMITGTSNPYAKSANFAIFYVDKTAKKPGGTGHTMRVCRNLNVNYIDQTTWFTWLD